MVYFIKRFYLLILLSVLFIMALKNLVSHLRRANIPLAIQQLNLSKIN